MKTIKIKYVDMWKSFLPEREMFYEFLCNHPEKYKVEFSDDPDYILFGVFGNENLKYDCIRIFVGHEYRFPDFNMCDYAVGNCDFDFPGRYYYYPIIYTPFYREAYKKMENRNADGINIREKEFCAFTYSNRYANRIREEFFHELNNYKRIDSGGRFMNNVGGPVKDKLEFESQYKFSIAFENETAPGYMTEKISESFAAGCVPIYWGDPLIKRVFNEKAFINISDFASIDEAIELIKKIDNDDELYYKMIKESTIKDEFKLENMLMGFDKFASYIFDQPIEEARRLTVRWYLERARRNKKILDLAERNNELYTYLMATKYRLSQKKGEKRTENGS